MLVLFAVTITEMTDLSKRIDETLQTYLHPDVQLHVGVAARLGQGASEMRSSSRLDAHWPTPLIHSRGRGKSSGGGRGRGRDIGRGQAEKDVEIEKRQVLCSHFSVLQDGGG